MNSRCFYFSLLFFSVGAIPCDCPQLGINGQGEATAPTVGVNFN
jgi:hypothetical protein